MTIGKGYTDRLLAEDEVREIGRELGLPETCMNFDLGNACLGFVNGMDMGSINALPNWRKVGDNWRDVYIRIDAGPSEMITSIAIARDPSGFNDGVFLDHLAFSPVPVPTRTRLRSSGTSRSVNMPLIFFPRKSLSPGFSANSRGVRRPECTSVM